MSHFLQLHQNLIDDMDDHMSFMVYMTYMVKKKIKSQPGVFETCFVKYFDMLRLVRHATHLEASITMAFMWMIYLTVTFQGCKIISPLT